MALVSPRNTGHCLGSAAAPVVLEAYLDYVCPFSRKFYTRFVQEVFPYVEQQYPNQVQFIFRHQVQPWHPQSTIVHEAALAVEQVNPDAFFPYSNLLFEHQEEYFDRDVFNASRQAINQKLAALAVTTGVDVSKVGGLMALVQSEDKNAGTEVTNQLKLHIKMGRQQGIHISPTVLYNGLIDNSISSSWSLDQWKDFFKAKLG